MKKFGIILAAMLWTAGAGVLLWRWTERHPSPAAQKPAGLPPANRAGVRAGDLLSLPASAGRHVLRERGGETACFVRTEGQLEIRGLAMLEGYDAAYYPPPYPFATGQPTDMVPECRLGAIVVISDDLWLRWLNEHLDEALERRRP